MTTEQHPIAAMAFWQTSEKEIDAMKAVYDELIGADPAKAAKLQSLLQWAGEQKACDDAYNNTDFSGT